MAKVVKFPNKSGAQDWTEEHGEDFEKAIFSLLNMGVKDITFTHESETRVVVEIMVSQIGEDIKLSLGFGATIVE